MTTKPSYAIARNLFVELLEKKLDYHEQREYSIKISRKKQNLLVSFHGKEGLWKTRKNDVENLLESQNIMVKQIRTQSNKVFIEYGQFEKISEQTNTTRYVFSATKEVTTVTTEKQTIEVSHDTKESKIAVIRKNIYLLEDFFRKHNVPAHAHSLQNDLVEVFCLNTEVSEKLHKHFSKHGYNIQISDDDGFPVILIESEVSEEILHRFEMDYQITSFDDAYSAVMFEFKKNPTFAPLAKESGNIINTGNSTTQFLFSKPTIGIGGSQNVRSMFFDYMFKHYHITLDEAREPRGFLLNKNKQTYKMSLKKQKARTDLGIKLRDLGFKLWGGHDPQPQEVELATSSKEGGYKVGFKGGSIEKQKETREKLLSIFSNDSDYEVSTSNYGDSLTLHFKKRVETSNLTSQSRITPVMEHVRHNSFFEKLDEEQAKILFDELWLNIHFQKHLLEIAKEMAEKQKVAGDAIQRLIEEYYVMPKTAVTDSFLRPSITQASLSEEDVIKILK